jgi:magnesium-transporting ATPase (P-type)
MKYQASSPDELALVEGADRMGYRLLSRTTNSITIQVMDGVKETYHSNLYILFYLNKQIK